MQLIRVVTKVVELLEQTGQGRIEAPQGILAVMADKVAMGLFNTPTVIAQLRDGRLKALGVTRLQRSPLLPDVPTLDEAGIKGDDVNTWFGFITVTGT